MATTTQQTVMTLACSAGKDLLFKRMSAREELGHLFEFDIGVVSKKEVANPDDLLGKPASVAVVLANGKERHFHGLVCALGIEGATANMYNYRLVLRPWVWLLTRRSDTRVFQKMTMEEILKKVFDHFSPDYEFEISGTLPKYEYCVQYRESDFNFVSRLMEQEGVYYYFRHTGTKHTMVIVNSPSAHKPCPFQEKFEFRELAVGLRDFDPVTDWRVKKEIQSGQVVLRDFDFAKPAALESIATATRKEASAKLEVYDYPGFYPDKSAGERYSKLRVEELQARYSRVEGFGSVRALACGFRFTLASHPRPDQNKAHLVVSTQIECAVGGYESSEDQAFYNCHFTAMEGTEVFRPDRATPKPSVAGLHTAIVVGPKGDEIHTDEHGRVKLQFHWDRIGKMNDMSSCFVRVSNPSAGKGWGSISLPRIGQEVVVDFLEGDPDRPLITGVVYNGEQTPPYTLPANATVSTVKSRSSKAGGAGNFNEIRFQDDKDAEYVWFQAERDFHQLVKHDATLRVMGDQERIFEGKVTEEVKSNVMVKIGGDVVNEIGGMHSRKVSGHMTAQSSQSISMDSGTTMEIKIGTSLAADAGQDVYITAGANVVIDAAAKITLKAGGSSVVIGPSGVTIDGAMVKLNSGGSGGSGKGAKPKAVKTAEPPEKKKDPLA